MHTDTDRMKWLNWFVQNDDHVLIEMDSGGKIVLELSSGKSVEAILVGDEVEDAIDQAMAEFPMPAV
jgi:hypothetical protein